MFYAVPQDTETLGKLAQAVADFKARYSVVMAPSYAAKINASGDASLIGEYNSLRSKMTTANSALTNAEKTYSFIKGIGQSIGETATGAWDSIKDFFGLSGLGQLGILPLIPIAIAAGILTVLGAAIFAADSFMKRAGIKQIQQEKPGVSYEQAAAIYDQANQSTFGKAVDTAQLALVIGAGALLWFMFGRK